MQGLLRGTLLLAALAAAPAALRAQPAPPDTAALRTALAAVLGDDFEIARTELHAGMRERSGTFWLVHARPRRSGDYDFRYTYDFRDRARPERPLYTHVEHTATLRIGEAGCLRRAERRDACVGDVLVLPVVAGDVQGGYAGHAFALTRRGAGPAIPAAHAADSLAPGPNPAAPHLHLLGTRLEEMPHRNLGMTVEAYALFRAEAPGALALSLDGGRTVPVVVVERGTPVTVLLLNERIRSYHATDGFASHTGNQYATDVLLLQPGDRVALPYLTRTVRGRDFTGRERDAFRRLPEIAAGPLEVRVDERFNAWIAPHLPRAR